MILTNKIKKYADRETVRTNSTIEEYIRRIYEPKRNNGKNSEVWTNEKQTNKQRKRLEIQLIKVY